MAPPELLEIAKHRCFDGTLYRFEHISPVGCPKDSSRDRGSISRYLKMIITMRLVD